MKDQIKCKEGNRWPISECPNMKEVDGDTDMSFEHYECKECGLRDYLDYDEMR